MIGLNVTVKNDSNQTIKDNLTLSLFRSMSGKESRYGFEGPSALINNKLKQVKIKKIKKKNIFPGDIKWIAVQDRYFMSAIVPDEAVTSRHAPLL